MKRLIIAIVALALSACASSQGQPAQNASHISARICQSLQLVASSAAVYVAADPALGADLSIAQLSISAVCNGGVDVLVSDLNDLATNGLPSLTRIVEAIPIPDDDKQGARVSIALAQAFIIPMVFQ